MVRQPEKPPYLYRIVRKNKRKPPVLYWRSAPPGLEPELRISKFLTQEIVNWALERNKRAAKIITPAATGTFKHLADIFRGVPVEGVKPSKSQQKAEPWRYGASERVKKPSQQWLELRSRTKRDYTRYVDKLLARFGKFPVADFDEEMAVGLRDSLRETPRVANYMLNVLSAMMVVALEHPSQFGLTRNPVVNIKRLGQKAGVKPRQEYWTYEAELQFLGDADLTDPMIAIYERLLAYSGQRPGDVRAMTDEDFDGEKICVVQSKTGARVWIPCHKDLKPHIERNIAAGRAAGLTHFTLVRGVRGKPMGERYASSRWDAIAERTDTIHFNRQDLRRTAVMRLFEADCNTAQVASITGHSLKQVETILETYFVRTYGMAQKAITKLEQHQDLLAHGRFVCTTVVPLAATAEHVALIERMKVGARLIWRGDAEAGKPYLIEGKKNLGQRPFLIREMVARGWIAPRDPGATPLDLVLTEAGAGLGDQRREATAADGTQAERF